MPVIGDLFVEWWEMADFVNDARMEGDIWPSRDGLPTSEEQEVIMSAYIELKAQTGEIL